MTILIARRVNNYVLFWCGRHINIKPNSRTYENGMRLLHLFTVHDGQIFKEREVEIAWLAGRPINDIHTIIGLRKPEFEPGKQAVETKTVKFLRKL